jgi:hypothetical protein
MNGKLTKGMLIFINTDEGAQFDNVDENKFELRSGSSLYYDNIEVENTYAVFLVSTDEVRGDDQNSNWFKKYALALRNLDKIRQTPAEKDNFYKESQKIWEEGNTLLDADINYLDKEKNQISLAAIAEIDKKFKNLTQPTQPIPSSITTSILAGLTGSSAFNTFVEAAPATGSFLSNQDLHIDPNKPVVSEQLESLNITPQQLSELLDSDKKEYIKKLHDKNIRWNLGD